MPVNILTLPDDVAALHAIVAAQAAELAAKDGLIGTLRLQLARLRRERFGRSSERLDRDIAQLELSLEELEAEQGTTPPAAPTKDGDKDSAPGLGRRGGRCRTTCRERPLCILRRHPALPAAAPCGRSARM